MSVKHLNYAERVFVSELVSEESAPASGEWVLFAPAADRTSQVGGMIDRC